MSADAKLMASVETWLWITISVVVAAELALLGYTFLMFTRLRLGASVVGAVGIAVMITNAIVAYGNSEDILYLTVDTIGVILYFNVMTALLLSIGRAFDRRGRDTAYWLVCAAGMLFTLLYVCYAVYRMGLGVFDEYTTTFLRTFPVAVGLLISFAAGVYALTPLLMTIRTRASGDTDMFATSFWYLVAVAPVHILYTATLLWFITSAASSLPLARNAIILLRMLPLLVLVLPPPSNVLKLFKRRLFPNHSMLAKGLLGAAAAASSSSPSSPAFQQRRQFDRTKRQRDDDFFEIILTEVGETKKTRAAKTASDASLPPSGPGISEPEPVANRSSRRWSDGSVLLQSPPQSWFGYNPSRFSAYRLPNPRWTPLNLEEIVAPVYVGTRSPQR